MAGRIRTVVPVKPIVRSSVAELVYQELRKRLMHGEYPAGQQLVAQELADALGTSTMPVRDGLRRLIAQQGLEPLQNGSTRVPLITDERLQDLRRARVMVEGQMTEWAGPRLSAGQLDRLDELAAEITEARTSRDTVSISLEKNLVFHFTIYEAADSPVLMGVVESLWLQTGAYLREVRELLHGRELAADRLHEATVAALRQGDYAGARRCIEADLSWVFDRVGSQTPSA